MRTATELAHVVSDLEHLFRGMHKLGSILNASARGGHLSSIWNELSLQSKRGTLTHRGTDFEYACAMVGT